MSKYLNAIQENLFDLINEIGCIPTMKFESSTKTLKDRDINFSQLCFTEVVCEELADNIDNNEEILDYFLQRETLATELKKRYEDNITALKLLNKLENEDRKATKKEQSVLAKYSGWGGFASKFEKEDSKLELQNLLKENFKSARRSTLTSYYTNLNTIKFIYKVIARLGFYSGRILEPSLGTGRFIGGLSEDVFYNSRITGIEIDKTTSMIAKHLYQGIEILNLPFEDVELKDNSFDLIVSNIPFGDIPVHGKTDKALNKLGLSIHDYYFLKSIKKVRDGGIIVFITSTYTMDKEKTKIRELIDKECNLVGAVRLPVNTFLDTSVSTDIIFLQKDIKKSKKYFANVKDDELIGEVERNSWLYLKNDKNGKLINQYYVDNPHMMLGEMEEVTTQFGESYCLINNDGIGAKDYEKLLKYFPCEVYENSLDDKYMYEDSEILSCYENEEVREGEYVIKESMLYQRQGNSYIPKRFNGKRKSLFIDYIGIKETVKILINKELNDCNDEELKEIQNELTKKYDGFLLKYGNINDKVNKKVLEDDVMYYLISCLEEYDVDKKIYYKADIFTKRTINISATYEKPSTYEDAVIISYNNTGEVDIDYISELMREDRNTTIKSLLEKRLIYFNPQTSKYESKEEYLSGNVKKKLRYLENNFATDEAYKYNIEDLRNNQPEYVYDVYFDICSTWIPIEVKNKFIKEKLKLPPRFKLTYSYAVGYSIVGDYYVEPALNYVEWGTSRRKALDVVLATLNMTSITVYDYLQDPVTGTSIKKKNAEETQIALEKQNKWKMEFSDYVMNDVNLYKELVDIYNEECVLFKERNYTNIFKDLRINPNIKLMNHQLVAASRIITSSNSTLLCHSVGTGKSYTSICAMHEWKRIGNFRNYDEEELMSNGHKKIGKGNILFAIPNSLCMSGQFAREYLKLYPQANILATTPKDFTRANRRKILSKMIMYKWDAIIIPHSVLGLIPIKPESEYELMQEEEQELIELLNYYNNEEDRLTIKEIEKKLERHRVSMEKLYDMKKDEGLVYWEDLNVDRLVIDESQAFKNLAITTKLSRINGVSVSPSKRAKDLHNKIKLHRKVYGERGIVFLSATPISNSVSELYIINEYIGKGILKSCGINCFDDYASRFGEIVASMEVDVTGQNYRITERFSKFKNIPELVVMFRLISDIVFTEDIEDIVVPKLIGGKPTVITVEPTKEMGEYIDGLVERAEKIWSGSVKPNEDNMLNVVTQGRLLAVSPYLVGVDGDSPKINVLCDNVYKLYKEYPTETQVIFCDLGTPGGSTYCVYDEIKEKLIYLGVKEEEIAYIHDGNTDTKRKNLIDTFNSGKVKVLIGSTEKLGIGVNMQQHLKFAHHVNCPWKSSEIEQRDGRIVRQLNSNSEVQIFRYILNRSFDAYSWQCVERKARFIKQVISNKTTTREMEDVDTNILSYAEAKACACGDSRIMRLCELNNEVQKLQLLEKAFKEQKVRILSSVKIKEEKIEENEERLIKLQKELSKFNKGDNILRLKSGTYSNAEELTNKIQKLLTNDFEGIIGEINDLKIEFKKEFELGTRVYKAYIGNCIKFNTKKSAKVVISNILSIKDTLEEKINTAIKISNDLRCEIDGLNNSFKNEFKEKEKLVSMIEEKRALEIELSVNKQKVG